MSLFNDLLSFYKLDEVSGTRFDSVGDNDLTDIGTVTSNVGVVGSGAEFDLANLERLDAANSGVLAFGDEDFTLATWVRLEDTINQGMINKWDSSAVRSYNLFYLGSASRFQFSLSADGSAATNLQASTFGAPSQGDWNFVVAWYDATANLMSIQVNDGTVDTAAHTGGAFKHNAELFRLGKTNVGATDRYLTGGLDAVGVWNRILTGTERTQLYNNGIGREPPFYTDKPATSIGGFLNAENPPIVSGVFGGYTFGVRNTSAGIGGYLFARAAEDANRVGILGGYALGESNDFPPISIGGFIRSLELLPFGPVFIGGGVSGLLQNDNNVIGGYTFGRPSGVEFTELHARTLVKVRSEDVVDQGINLDAQLILKQVQDTDFNARFVWAGQSSSDFNAKFKVEEFANLPTIQILSVTPSSGAPGETGGCTQVTVVASGVLGDGDEWINTQIDFGEPLQSSSPRVFTENLSISGFSGPPPWTTFHDYCVSGRYVVTVRGQDNKGLVAMDCFQLNLASGLSEDNFPRVSINAVPRQGTVPDSVFVQFSLEASGLPSPPFTQAESNATDVVGNSDRRIFWSFGNRATSQRTNPNTYYQTPGLYAPTLRYLYDHPSGGKMWVSDTLLIGFNN
jgi:hypothetical protein